MYQVVVQCEFLGHCNNQRTELTTATKTQALKAPLWRRCCFGRRRLCKHAGPPAALGTGEGEAMKASIVIAAAAALAGCGTARMV